MRLSCFAVVSLLACMRLRGCAGRPAPAAVGVAAACVDSPTPDGHTCAQQKAWGKCADMAGWGGFCSATCGRCSTTAPAPPPSSPPPVVISPPPALPPAAPANATGNPSGRAAQYSQALQLSYQFIYAQRSGKLSSGPNPNPWRHDSHLADPVVGGYYDAGDHLKLNFPLATSLAFLAWGALDFPSGYATAGAAAAAQDSLKWGAAYLMACHTSDNTFIAQIGNPGPDHAYWGRPEDDTQTPRTAYTWDASKPASDAVGAAASALAATALVLRPSDPAFAAQCLDHARRLFAFAAKYEGKYSDSQPAATYVYPSSSFLDDLAFAAGWLWRATGEDAYLAAARSYLKRAQYQRNYFVSWDSVYVAADVLLAGQGAAPVEGVDHTWQIAAFVDAWTKGQQGIKFSPRGLAVAPLGGWGNGRYSANAAFLMLLHAAAAPTDAATAAKCVAFAASQLDYLLGLAGSDRSYVTGFGVNPPTHAHHRAASCPNPPATCSYSTAFEASGPNPQPLVGALVGGPNDRDVYADKRSDYQANEVAFDYNAGFTGALAGLLQLQGGGGGAPKAAA